MSQKILNFMFSFAILALGININSLRNKIKEIKPPDIKVEYVGDRQPDFFSKSPQEGLMGALEYYDIKHPEIVHAQAILETGNFTSKLCLVDNNLFGLYNSNTRKYYSFGHWSESVVAYINYVQYRYKPPDNYYKFLQDIGYASDSQYINKVKEIMKQNDKRRSK